MTNVDSDNTTITQKVVLSEGMPSQTAENENKNIFTTELSNHIKFTIAAVFSAITLIVVMRFGVFSAYRGNAAVSQNLFEGFFIGHLFFASLTPAALFSIYRRTLLPGIALAVTSSALTCTLSDIVLPYLGGTILSYGMYFHVCIIEEPILAWSFIISGAFLGYFLSQYVRKLSTYTHSAHILLSSLAAGLYLISYGVNVLSIRSLLFIPILIVSVLIPCVMNDIGVPTLIVSFSSRTGRRKEELLESLHEEHHGHKHQSI